MMTPFKPTRPGRSAEIPLEPLKLVDVPRIIFQTPPLPKTHSPPVSTLREPSYSPTRPIKQTGHLPITENTLPIPTTQKSETTLPTQIKHESENAFPAQGNLEAEKTLPAPVSDKYKVRSYPKWTSQKARADKESILSGFTPEELEDLPPGFPYVDWIGVCALAWEFVGGMQRLITDFVEGQGGSGKWGAV